jgi:ABC-type transporter Mla subunit MlaD
MVSDDRKNDLRIGIFTIIAVAIVITGSILFGEVQFTEEGKRYIVNFTFLNGLKEGAKVSFSGGILIGRVEKLTATEKYAQVHIVIQEDIKITECSEFKISAEAMLGEKYIQIITHEEGCRQLPPGSEIVGTDPPDMEQIILDITSAALKIKDVLSAFDMEELTGMFDMEGLDLSEGINSIFDLIKEILREKSDDIDRVFQEAEGVIGNIDGAIYEARDFISMAKQSLDAVNVNEINSAVSDLRSFLNETSSKFEQINAEDINTVITQIIATLNLTQNIVQGLSNSVNAYLDDLGQYTQDTFEGQTGISAILAEAHQTVSSANDVVAQIDSDQINNLVTRLQSTLILTENNINDLTGKLEDYIDKLDLYTQQTFEGETGIATLSADASQLISDMQITFNNINDFVSVLAENEEGLVAMFQDPEVAQSVREIVNNINIIMEKIVNSPIFNEDQTDDDSPY